MTCVRGRTGWPPVPLGTTTARRATTTARPRTTIERANVTTSGGAGRHATNSGTAWWEGGWRRRAEASGLGLVGDEPEGAGGNGGGPIATQCMLTALPSCHPLVLAWDARKARLTLRELA